MKKIILWIVIIIAAIFILNHYNLIPGWVKAPVTHHIQKAERHVQKGVNHMKAKEQEYKAEQASRQNQ